MNRRDVLRLACLCASFLSLGCAGIAPLPSSPASDSGDESDVTRSYGSKRGIQAVYWLALDPTFATAVCASLNKAPSGKTVEIEFSAGHDGGQKWANAITAINTLSSRGLSLVVDFGHHIVASDYSAEGWGKELCNGLFKTYYNSVSFTLQVANEDDYTDDEWTKKIQAILKGMKSAWGNDKTFPYSSLNIRRTPIKPGATVPTSVIFDKKKIPVRSEYHFPSDEDNPWKNGAKAVSNDGQLAYDKNDNVRAYGPDGKSLKRVTLTKFKSTYGSRTLLLWHPILHLWRFKDGAYYATGKRENANADNQLKFLNQLDAFIAS